MKHTPLPMSAIEMVDSMRAGIVRATEIMRALLDRISDVEPGVHAWAYLDREAALKAAADADAARAAGRILGPLHGLPVGVKDIIDTCDMPTEFGTVVHRGRRPMADAILVARLRAAGAIILGKTVTSEYAFFKAGPTCNPHDTTRTPGGSSSGSAAAVAANMVPAALATQSVGSAIRPASFCGVVGYKPTLGILPRTGILRQSDVLDQPAVMATCVADVAFVTEAICGHDPADARSLHERIDLIATMRDDREPPHLALARGPYWARADAITRAAIERLAAELSVPVAEVELPPAFADAAEIIGTLVDAGIAQAFRADAEAAPAQFPDVLMAAMERGRRLSAVDVLEALARRDDLRQQFDRLAAPYTALLTPAAVGVAPPLREGTGDPIFAATWTLVGAPAISLPILRGSGGLPLGLQMIAGSRQDGALLRAASWVTQATRNQ